MKAYKNKSLTKKYSFKEIISITITELFSKKIYTPSLDVVLHKIIRKQLYNYITVDL